MLVLNRFLIRCAPDETHDDEPHDAASIKLEAVQAGLAVQALLCVGPLLLHSLLQAEQGEAREKHLALKVVRTCP